MDPENSENIEIEERRFVLRAIRVTWILTCIAVGLLVVGFASPGFRIVQLAETVTVYIGVWYSVVCIDGECTAMLMDLRSDNREVQVISPYKIVYPILATFATAFGIASIITELVLKCCRLSLTTTQWTSVVLFLAKIASGFFAIVATIEWSTYTHLLQLLPKKPFDLVSVYINYFPFSVFLFGVGGTILFVVSILPHMYYLYKHDPYTASGNVQHEGWIMFHSDTDSSCDTTEMSQENRVNT